MTKNNLIIILIFLLKAVKLSSPLIFILIFNFSKYKLVTLIILIIYLLVVIIYSFIKWSNIILILNKKYIEYKYGVFFKKSIKLSINNLTVIKIKQSLIQKIFNICTLKLKDGNINNKNAEVIMILKNDIALSIKNEIKQYENKLILNKKNNVYSSKIKIIFKITKKELMLFAMTGNNIAFGIGVIVTVKKVLEKLEKHLNFHIINTVAPMIKFKVIYENYGEHIVYIIFGAWIIFFILSTLISIIQKFIKFYDFRIYRNTEDIILTYGLISQKQYTIPIKNVIAIKLSQNFIKQIFNLYRLKIYTVGYGQEKNEQAILYPIANNAKSIKILKELFPELNSNINIIKSPKRAMSKFFILPINVFLVFYLIFIILNFKFKIFIFLLPILIFSRYLNYKNVSIGFNNNIFIGINGGFYKNILILKNSKIQSIEKRSTYFQRRKNLCTYKINHVKGNINLKHLDEKIFEKLINKYKF